MYPIPECQEGSRKRRCVRNKITLGFPKMQFYCQGQHFSGETCRCDWPNDVHQRGIVIHEGARCNPVTTSHLVILKEKHPNHRMTEIPTTAHNSLLVLVKQKPQIRFSTSVHFIPLDALYTHRYATAKYAGKAITEGQRNKLYADKAHIRVTSSNSARNLKFKLN
ncbi:hypothetical protein MAR_037504 [Mya arenaria]|uniref:Uncharacterized protein n=1 Tax=Mya arenaria TaxID=6604 RepID=A0ABY7FP50_MYAAR|nr:hypothetical protein MAR_037504 [Mya arenaria]